MRPILTASLVAFATAAAAQDAPRRPMMSDGCRTEVMKICAPTGNRAAMRQCMMASVDKFSEPCKAELAKMRAMMRQRMQRRGDMAPAQGHAPSTSDTTMPPADQPL